MTPNIQLDFTWQQILTNNPWKTTFYLKAAFFLELSHKISNHNFLFISYHPSLIWFSLESTKVIPYPSAAWIETGIRYNRHFEI